MVESRAKQSSGVAKAGLATAAGLAGWTLLNGGVPTPFGGGAPFRAAVDYVTDKDMGLIREIGEKDAIIAGLRAEKYADAAVAAAVAPLQARVCALETQGAVNAARDQEFRRYVNREFVHQPKASMRDCIVTTQTGCCCCGGGNGAESAA